MILVRSPLRVSLSGGGSDFPGFFEGDFGRCITLAINKYVYVAFHDTFNEGYRLAYSSFENVNSINEIKHPVFREALRYFDIGPKIEIGSYADVPGSGTGLGSSSAFTSCLVKGLSLFKGQKFDSLEIGRISTHIEIELCGDPIGFQDQYASALGGIQDLYFSSGSITQARPIYLNPFQVSKLESSLVLLYLGYGRQSSAVLKEHQNNLKHQTRSHENIRKIRDLTPDARRAIENSDFVTLGNVIRESWILKKRMASGVSDANIDAQILKAVKSGSLGEKVVGAGGGGFLLAVVNPMDRESFISKMQPLKPLEFKLSQNGTEVLFQG